jgi:hypothetical protein
MSLKLVEMQHRQHFPRGSVLKVRPVPKPVPPHRDTMKPTAMLPPKIRAAFPRLTNNTDHQIALIQARFRRAIPRFCPLVCHVIVSYWFSALMRSWRNNESRQRR